MDRRKSLTQVNNELANNEIKPTCHGQNSNDQENLQFYQEDENNNRNAIRLNNVNNPLNGNKLVKPANSSSKFSNTASGNFPYSHPIHHDEHQQETEFGFNFGNAVSEVYLSDDLSLLPVIDEKSVIGCMKTKFESKKCYVRMKSSLLLFI